MYHVSAQGVDERMINVHQVIIIIIIVSTCARTTDRRLVCCLILTRLCLIFPCVSSYRVHLICSILTRCSVLMLYKDI